MFEFATKNKMRFPFKGMISVEDLWDLSLDELDVVFKNLNADLKQSNEASLLESANEENEYLTTQINIVKHVFECKKAAINKALRDKERYEKKQDLMRLIVAKQNDELASKSIDELKTMLEELD